MKKTISILLSICMIFGLFAGTSFCTETAQAASAITSQDFLKANGKNLCNNYGNGSVVQLKGTNAGGYLIQEFWMTITNSTSHVTDEQDIYNKLTERFGTSGKDYLVGLYQDNYWTTADFDNCAAMGMNCIRLPFWYQNIRKSDGSLDFTRLDWFVAQAGQRGMYVVIDFHGAPGSQNGSDHSGIDGGNDKLGASQFFFGNNAYNNQQIYYDMWYKIAQHFAGNPTVAGYDLLNEPYCTYRYNSGYSDSYLRNMLWNIYNNAYNVIRSADPDHVIIMEATWDPVDLPDPSQYGWTNIMYEYHNYNYGDYDNAAGQQISNMQTKVNAIKSANYNVPSYMGEFCYFNNLNAWDEGLALLTDAGINWTSWTYKVISDYGNWGLYNQTNLQANIETDSWDTLCNKYSRVGESWANTGLINVMKKYFTKAAVAGGATSGTGSGSAASASISNGEYYLKVANSSNTEYVVCAENAGADPLVANRSSYGGAWESVTVVNNSDGTISLKSGANDKYVCAVIDENNQLLARSASIGTWEKFYLVQAGDGKFGLKALANDKYVCADFNNGGTLRAISDSVAGSWEAFTFHKVS
ncbi:MAG: cellulase family glycosylhydrolase [Lachnospiraceae bacterium]|nr:cellulase family glycosylhydrolase [Lachnospiraceae bacterium]